LSRNVARALAPFQLAGSAPIHVMGAARPAVWIGSSSAACPLSPHAVPATAFGVPPPWVRIVGTALAASTLAAHLAFIVWVVFGAFLTRGRRRLAGLHLASLVYGVVIEAGPWPCPLTLAENWFEAQAGLTPYRGPFLVHSLDAIVYPDISPALLIWAAVVVALVNAWVYFRRWRHRPAPGGAA
jgi:hypothetical protein